MLHAALRNVLTRNTGRSCIAAALEALFECRLLEQRFTSALICGEEPSLAQDGIRPSALTRSLVHV